MLNSAGIVWYGTKPTNARSVLHEYGVLSVIEMLELTAFFIQYHCDVQTRFAFDNSQSRACLSSVTSVWSVLT